MRLIRQSRRGLGKHRKRASRGQNNKIGGFVRQSSGPLSAVRLTSAVGMEAEEKQHANFITDTEAPVRLPAIRAVENLAAIHPSMYEFPSRRAAKRKALNPGTDMGNSMSRVILRRPGLRFPGNPISAIILRSARRWTPRLPISLSRAGVNFSPPQVEPTGIASLSDLSAGPISKRCLARVAGNGRAITAHA